ncbi:hypothetical protein UlMin_019329 [Ulmus minor]
MYVVPFPIPLLMTSRPKKTQPIRAMRVIVQRVTSASVEVQGRKVSEIGPGLLVLVGLHDPDSDSDAIYTNCPWNPLSSCQKVLNLRLFPNETSGRGWNQNVMPRNYEVLLVSQFTLYGFLKGKKPNFHVAMPPEKAKPFYAYVVDMFKISYNLDAIKGNLFGPSNPLCYLTNNAPPGI